MKPEPSLSPGTPSPPRRVEQLALVAILVVFSIAGLIYSISTPFLDVSDEVRHYAMIEHLAQGNGLPVQDPQQHGFYEQEGSQPPLYYALMALVALPFDRGNFMQLAHFNVHARLGRADATNNWNQLIHTEAEQFPWHGAARVVQIIRWLGILMGAVTALCTYGIAKELTAGVSLRTPPLALSGGLVPLLAAAFTAFNPMFVFINASVNNDSLATMLSSLGLLLGARIVRRGLTWRNAAALGVVLGGAALSKASALALVVVVPAAILFSEWLRQRNKNVSAPLTVSKAICLLRAPARPLLLSVAIVIATAGWWYARNLALYGDFTGTTMMATIAGAREALPGLGEIIGEWDGFRKAYWGLFGAVNIPMDLWIYSAFDVVLVLAGVGLLLVVRDGLNNSRLFRGASPHPPELRSPSPDAGTEQSWVIAVLMCFGTFLIAFAALVRWTSLTLASQGRLLFPIIAVISTFIALGLGRLMQLERRPEDERQKHVTSHVRAPSLLDRARDSLRLTFLALPFALAALTLASPFLYIRPAYATPQRLQNEGQLPPDLTRTELRFSDAIRWIGYQVESTRVQPGDELHVTLYWQGLRPMSTNYSAGIRLFGRNETEVLLLDTYPGGGMWQTTRWQPGEIIADRYRLRIPDTFTITALMPTVLRLDVGFWDYDSKQFLDTFESDSGKPTGRQRYPVAALATHGTPVVKAPSPYLSQARPMAIDVQQPGDKLTVKVTWAATADINEDYTVFMHLFNAGGEKVSQADSSPASGDFPTRWWRQGDRVEDSHTFDDLPANLPAGNYMLKFGLYRPGDDSRMPAFDAQGQPIPDGALSQTVTIK